MIVDTWIISRGEGFLVLVETEEMLFYLSDHALEPSGFMMGDAGSQECFWVTMAKDAAIQFDSKEDAEQYVTDVCRFHRGKSDNGRQGWRIPNSCRRARETVVVG